MYFIFHYYAEAFNKFAEPILAALRPDNLAPFKEMLQRWRAVGNSVFDLTGPRFESQTSHFRDERINTRPTGWFKNKHKSQNKVLCEILHFLLVTSLLLFYAHTHNCNRDHVTIRQNKDCLKDAWEYKKPFLGAQLKASPAASGQRAVCCAGLSYKIMSSNCIWAIVALIWL